MLKLSITRSLCAGALITSPLLCHAVAISDATGDILPTYGGGAGAFVPDLDVVSATVLYDAKTDMFALTATMNGAIGTTRANIAYVWGVNRGAGTPNATFAAAGVDGVRFDGIVRLLPDGTGATVVSGVTTNLSAGSVAISGNTITGYVSGSLLSSTGFSKPDYTWNVWPRDNRYAGFAAISDFAPDNTNFASTLGTVAAVPEPETLALMLAGLGAMGLVMKRRRRQEATA